MHVYLRLNIEDQYAMNPYPFGFFDGSFLLKFHSYTLFRN